MTKNKYYKDFSKEEIDFGYESMTKELKNDYTPKWIITLFNHVWKEFKKNKFSYDGATFVKERYDDTLFEVASFIHDYLNYIGYVGKNVDKLFIIIMKTLKYPEKQINKRKCFMKFTFINIFIHIFADNYIGDINLEKFIKAPS